jgi:hypothetical protein
MSRPAKKRSHEGATATGAGEVHFTRAHTAVGVYVEAHNLDPDNDTLTVSLEGGFEDPQGTDHLAPVYDGNSAKKITESDFSDDDGDGTYEMLLWGSNVPVEKIRARITEFSDSANGDLEVDTWVLMSNNASGGGHSFEADST